MAGQSGESAPAGWPDADTGGQVGSAGLGLRRLGRSVGATLARQTAAVAIGLISTIALARSLGPGGTGQLGLVLFLTNLWVTVFGLGLPVANAYAVGRDTSATPCAVRANQRLWLALAGLGLVVGVPVVGSLGPILFPTVQPAALAMAMVLFPVMLLEAMLLGILQGRQDFGSVNRVGVMVPITTLALVLALVVWRQAGLPGALLAYLGAHAVGMIVVVLTLRREVASGPSAGPCRPYARTAVGYGSRAVVGNLVALLNYRVDVYVLGLMTTASAVGVYTAAVQIAEKLWILSAAVGFVILPRIASLHQAEAARRRITPLMARWVLAATAGLALGVAVFGLPLIRLMGPGFEPAFGVLLWLLPGVALLAVARVVSADLAARGRPEYNVAATVVALGVEVAAIAILVPRMGIVGAAAASSLSYATVLLLVALLYARTVKQRPWTLLVPTSDDRQVVAVIGAMLVGWLRASSPADRLRG